MTLVLNRTLDGNFISRYAFHTAGEVMPRRIKRLMYMSTVLGVIIQNKFPGPDLLVPVNRVLKLARNSAALLLPVFLYEFFWKNSLQDTIHLSDRVIEVGKVSVYNINDKDLWKIALFFARRARPCMRYGSEELMIADIHDLLVVLSQVPCGRGICIGCEHCTKELPLKTHVDLLLALKKTHDYTKKSEPPELKG